MPLNLAYSFSRISDYACKRRFRKLYLEKKKEPQTVLALIGNMGHDVMKHHINSLYRYSVEKDPLGLAKAIDYVIAEKDRRHQWPEHFTKDDVTNTKNSLQDLFEDFKFHIDPYIKLAKVEQRMTFDSEWHLLPEDAWFQTSGIYFRAIIDWAYVPENENTLWIVDHKTGWGEPDEDQLKFYALAGFAGISQEVDRVGIKFHWIAQQGRMEDKGFFEPKEILEIRKEVNSRIQEIENNEDWKTVTPGKYCDYCGFTEDCPAVSKSMDMVKSDQPFLLDTKENAEKAFEMYLLVELRLKELKKALIQYVQDHEPISAAGKIMESRPKESWTLTDPYPLQKELAGLGIHPTDILNSTGISESKLKDLLKENGLIRHLEKLKEAHGETTKSMGEVKPYVLKKGNKKK